MTSKDREPSNALPSDPVGCAVQAYAAVRVPFDEIAALRKNPGPSRDVRISPSLMKHADHQSVLAIAAVLRAAGEFGPDDRSFEDWAVIAAPRFLGRVLSFVALDKFLRVGALGMSPLIVATLTLHAVASSVSLAIQSHGFNYGVGGGPNHLGEALLAGLASRDDGAPGVWVVATGFDPEPEPEPSGHVGNPAIGYAVALGLTPASTGRTRLNLRIVPTSARGGENTSESAPPSLKSLAEFLSESDGSVKPRRWFGAIPGGGAIEVEDDPARAVLSSDPYTRLNSRVG